MIFSGSLFVSFTFKRNQICTRQFEFAGNANDYGSATTTHGDLPINLAAGYFSVMVALLMMVFGVLCSVIGNYTKFLSLPFVSSLVTMEPLTVVFFLGLSISVAVWPAHLFSTYLPHDRSNQLILVNILVEHMDGLFILAWDFCWRCISCYPLCYSFNSLVSL